MQPDHAGHGPQGTTATIYTTFPAAFSFAASVLQS